MDDRPEVVAHQLAGALSELCEVWQSLPIEEKREPVDDVMRLVIAGYCSRARKRALLDDLPAATLLDALAGPAEDAEAAGSRWNCRGYRRWSTSQ